MSYRHDVEHRDKIADSAEVKDMDYVGVKMVALDRDASWDYIEGGVSCWPS